MTRIRSRKLRFGFAHLGAVILLSSGCNTSAGCLLFCDANDTTTTVDGGTWNGQFNVVDAQTNTQSDGSTSTQCSPTNGGNEICDGIDNNCNGQTDEGIDFHDPYHCGSCTNNCYSVLANADPSAIKCQWSGTAGQSGTCSFTSCAEDWFDLDKDATNGCEYPCTKTADDDSTCNNRDDNCNGLRDEDVNLCTSVTDCGRCGGACVVIHGTPACIHDGTGTCDSTNAHCSIQKCNDDNGDGSADWWDLDKSYATGCEYHCALSNGGVEICGDGLDNDCDGKIDDADDDLSGDKQLGVACTGSTQGACATAGHAGKTICVGNKVVCTGTDVIQPNQLPETCNGVDDDCNGIIDDALTDVGGTCGTSNLYPCSLGSQQCVAGLIVCIGAVEPGVEYCNGLDDDCNGKIDDNPVDAKSSCGHPTIGACQSGIQICNGGAIVCTGSVEPKAEICNGIDDDCNGKVDDNVPTVGSACGSSNTAPCQLGTLQCTDGQMLCLGGVEPQAETCDGVDNNCDGQVDNNVAGLGEACGSLQDSCALGATRCAQDATTQTYSMVCTGLVPKVAETCNGKDDDCNGLVDDIPSDVGADCGSSVGECRKGKTICEAGSVVCSGTTDAKAETCNGKDDDCNGVIDDNLTGIGQACGQSATAPCRLGTTQCSNGVITCAGSIDPQAETCDDVDNDCNGIVDDSVAGAGVPCGANNTYPCSYGTKRCQAGQLVCVGAVDPTVETCNGLDDDCDGLIDAKASGSGPQPPADSIGNCDVPAPPPANATTVCKAGTKACQSGTIICQGSIKPASGAVDTCGVDTNCDGQLTSQPNLQTDVHNCGSCGNDCYASTQNEVWTCESGLCKYNGCTSGFYDHDSDPKTCEYACAYVSAQESCNGKDDNCDGQTDENVTAPAKTQTCGISPSATRPECTTQVTLACQNGAWKCTFPAGVCSGGCSPDDEACDALDNDCDGLLNENVSNYGKSCASDDTKPVPGDGACRTTGTYVCNGPSATKCGAVRADCSTLPGGCAELCDGIDNDCDGAIDETTFEELVDNFFVKPAVVKIAASLWMFKYEASRTSASATVSGNGNGYFCTSNCKDGSNTAIPSAPTGVTLDKTRACSTASRVPWFNVTPIEAEQTCSTLGGHVCTVADWQTACRVNNSCLWGYDPIGACKTGYNPVTQTTFCNLGVSYQGGLLSTASSNLKHCSSDWSSLQGNPASTGIFDITGNLREITRSSITDYRLMGGAFNTDSELGATCDFSFYSVVSGFRLFDTGFRCCFASDPSI
jgi:hypothetical protein